jgi:hypothetical protein
MNGRRRAGEIVNLVDFDIEREADIVSNELNLEFNIRPARFGRVAVKKLSTQRTSSPRANSCSHRWEPMNPAPPVTRTRRLLSI